MCGIAGILGTKQLVQEPLLKKIAVALAHRGPDDEGVEIIDIDSSTSLGLVHRRLSIIDLSPGGHQPMRDKDTGNWIVYNGEIYNYKEIKIDLEKKGCKFSSESDTEVILKAYTAYGVECLEKLRGMFAFALWDAQAEKLFLAVDRFGIKPLYVYHKDGVFAFASETKTLLATGIVPREVEPAAVHSFLSFGAVQAPLTMIKGVSALLPGHYLIYDSVSGEQIIKEYWRPARNTECFHAQHSVSRGPFEEVLEDTVRHHLVSDVPVGLFLSGGVDSSALAILVNKVGNGPMLDSFSVGFSEDKYSELKYSRIIGEKFCKKHHEIILSETDLHSLLPQALEAMDQPTIDGINAYVISKAVRGTGIKTVLSGQGGDEVFGGYPTFRRIPKMVKGWPLVRIFPRWKRKMLARIIGHGSVARSKLAQYILSDGGARTFYTIARQLFSADDIQRIMPNVIASEAGSHAEGRSASGGQSYGEGIAASLARLAPRNDGLGEDDLFNQISILELRDYLANMLLRDGDVMSMAHGLEVRVPFLDHKLVECVFQIPAKQKINRSLPKPLLLNAVRDRMPKEIYTRKKMGFTFPWELWLRNQLSNQLEESLHDKDAFEAIGLDRRVCQNLWKQFFEHKGGITWSRVWACYILIHWARKNILS